MLVAACHILVIAGRGTEWETIGPTNNINGPRGVVYDPGACTGAFDSRYHKGLNIQGIEKHIRRYIPYQIFRLLYLLLRVVRPIELTVLFATIVPDANKAKTIQAYHGHVFASMGRAWVSEDISKALQSWLDGVIGLRLGLHDYRHLAIAIQRRYMDLREKNPNQNELALNRIRAHGKSVGDSHYGREDYLGSCSIDERDRALNLGREYHRIMGFTTGFNEELTQEAKKMRQEFSYTSCEIPLPKKRLGGQKKSNRKGEAVSHPPPVPQKRKANTLPSIATAVASKKRRVAVESTQPLRRSHRLKKPSAKAITTEIAETSSSEESSYSGGEEFDDSGHEDDDTN